MNSRANILTIVFLFSIFSTTVAVPAAGQECSFPVSMTDATGTNVTVTEEPSRVVTLSPSAAQTMWEIGAREKVIGVSKYAEYLDGAESRTQISTAEQLVSLETVVNLSPDLVLAPNVVPPETVEKLRDADVTVFYFPSAEIIEDVYEKTRVIGRLTGECDGAAETVVWMNHRINVAREAASGNERPGVLYLFFGYTAGSGTFINEIIEAAGGNNLAVDAGVTGYKPLSDEVVVRTDPDWIIRNSENPIGVKSEVINETTAAQHNQIVVVQIEHLNQPAPRIVYAITKLAKHFHPDAYAAANATATPTNTPTDTKTPTSTQGAQTTAPSATETPGQHGFGILAAGLGVLGSGLLLRSRYRR